MINSVIFLERLVCEAFTFRMISGCSMADLRQRTFLFENEKQQPAFVDF